MTTLLAYEHFEFTEQRSPLRYEVRRSRDTFKVGEIRVSPRLRWCAGIGAGRELNVHELAEILDFMQKLRP